MLGADCPTGLVCVEDLGRCATPGAAFVVEAGGQFRAAPDGNACVHTDGTGLCRRGECIRCDDGPAVAAQLAAPRRVAVAATGDVYLVDAGNQRVRRVEPAGIITTVLDYARPIAALGAAAPLDVGEVRGLMTDADNNPWLAAGACVLVLGGDGEAAPTGDAAPALVFGRDRTGAVESLARCVATLVEADGAMLAADVCAGVLIRLARVP